MTPLLSVDRLTVAFPGRDRWVSVVRDLSLQLAPAEILGLVGESGCGKTVTALAILGLVPPPGRIVGGEVRFAGAAPRGGGPGPGPGLRGSRLGFVFQEPGTALDPVFAVGSQLVEAIRTHRRLSRSAARQEALRLLDRVALPDPERLLSAFSHQLSGGQRQRVMIALALAGEPELLIADEPTTALDVTIQAQILELLERLRRDLGLAILLITHDLAVVAETCDRALVMYAGQAVEEGGVEALFAQPLHPYTRGLLAAVPRLGAPAGALAAIPGRVPAAARLPSGCAFHPRCSDVFEPCRDRPPDLLRLEGDRMVRCLLHDDRVAGGAGPQ